MIDILFLLSILVSYYMGSNEWAFWILFIYTTILTFLINIHFALKNWDKNE